MNCPYKNPDNCLCYPSHSLLPVSSVSSILGPDDSQLSLTLQSSYDTDDDDSAALSIEYNLDYPSTANNLILQADSDLTDDDDDSVAPSNVLFSSNWTLPTPSSQCVIVPTIVSPVEESLLRLLIKNNLPKCMYKDIMSWAHSASLHNYDFSKSLQYQTMLS